MASVVATTAPRTKPRRRSKGAKDQLAAPATPRTVKPTSPKSKQEDADNVVGEIAPGSEPCSGIEKRRQDDQEDYIRAHGNFGDARDKAEQEACNDQDNGVRDLDLRARERKPRQKAGEVERRVRRRERCWTPRASPFQRQDTLIWLGRRIGRDRTVGVDCDREAVQSESK